MEKIFKKIRFSRQKRLITILMVVPALIGLFLIFPSPVRNSVFEAFYIDSDYNIKAMTQFGFMMLSLSIMVFLFYYLQYGTENFFQTLLDVFLLKKKRSNGEVSKSDQEDFEELEIEINKLSSKYNVIEEELKDIKKLLSTIKSVKFSEKNKQEIIEDIYNKISQSEFKKEILTDEKKQELVEKIAAELNADAIKNYVNELQGKLHKEIEQKQNIHFSDKINEQIEPVKSRLSKEITRLSLRGNINLVIGIGITALGLWILWDTINTIPAQYISNALSKNGNLDELYQTLMVNYLPRLSLAFFVELLAYFFLRLYKKGLDEIKYFQNEMTTVESKFIAFYAAMFSEDIVLKKEVVETLSKTERNVVLEKGQTTVELERAKTDSKITQDFIAAIPNFFGSKQKKKVE